MIRFILVVIFLFFFALFSLIALPVEYLIGKRYPRFKQSSSQKIVVGAFHIILFLCGTRKKVIGLERIPKDQSVVYVANHRSYFDILLAYTTIPQLVGFISKKEVSRIPLLTQWMNNLKCLFLNREDAREGLKTILAGIEQIKGGTSMFIAPEGTRNQEKELLPFKPGSLKMAEKSGCPIVPVAISHADEIFEQHIPFIRRTHITIEYGEPIFVTSLDSAGKKMLLNTVKDQVQLMLEKND